MRTKLTRNFLFFANNNVYHICHRLRDIDSRNMHDLDFDLFSRPRSNVNMSMEMLHVTFCVGNSSVTCLSPFARYSHEFPNVLDLNL